ncbi:Mannonate dehydratase [Beutenbergia cavernae DSM 12333]|uniref:mannonate dehydratase n=1 Tax=Beutenbergia cavernae (strain ATCC BAA-8 / DSM 12333 / CCUG 43141 / JCM 11478 / NBRC 16432 / NCIMB 13614 / HKI 0122) TaxID=471853 RepID=C5C3Q2_BEUC1|nr:mannonate dehydratase [Beutenbergia cavernae]ACQ81961.1 Mannonate dehydratase [Beutenbergia cavernae DSM 12333]
MFQLSEFLSPRPEPWWPLLRQVGVEHVVAVMRGAEQEQRMYAAVGGAAGTTSWAVGEEPWTEASLRADMELFATHGFTVAAIEDTAPMDAVRLGLPGRDEQIEHILTQVRAMGRLGIPVLCYNWMAFSSWARTRSAVPTRGGALVTGFRLSDTADLPPLTDPAGVTPDVLWDALAYFLDAVLPDAEEAGVRLALHPDDPPLPALRGVPRIISSLDAYRRLLRTSSSPSNAITFCQGNFALMTDDVPAAIRELGGSDAIAFVHFRDLRGRADDFVEAFHDDGQTDMGACLRAYRDVGFSGPLRPDHVPTLEGESNDRPGYGVLGRLFATGYIRGLQHAIYGRPGASPLAGTSTG